MCKECGIGRCDARCPNAPEPSKFDECCHCGAEILDGDAYYDIEGDYYCEDCVDKMLKYAEVNWEDEDDF